MKDLRPAHEVIVEKILTHCENLKGVSKAIGEGGVMTGGRFFPAPMLDQFRMQEIGGLASQLGTLASRIIPEEKIPWVIEKLREADTLFRHCVISGTIEELLEGHKLSKEITFSSQM